MILRRPGLLLASIVSVVLGGAMFFQPSFEPPTSAQSATARVEIARRRQIPLNRDLWMTNRSRYGWILGDGFEESEGDGTWIMALEAAINFTLRPNRRASDVELQLLPLVSPVKPSRYFIFATSIDKQEITVDQKTKVLTVRLKLDGNTDQFVRITCDELDSPVFLRLGPDRRPMCAKLLKIHVKGS